MRSFVLLAVSVLAFALGGSASWLGLVLIIAAVAVARKDRSRLHDEMAALEARLRELEFQLVESPIRPPGELGAELTVDPGVQPAPPDAAMVPVAVQGQPPAVAPAADPAGAAEAGSGAVWSSSADMVRRALARFGPMGATAADIEAWLSGRLLAVVGGVALLIGAVFFLSLAFSRGWISEPIRVVIGLAASGVLLGLAVWLFGRKLELLGNVLVAVGLAVATLSFYAAAPLYGLVPIELALVGALVASLAAAAVAIRFDSQLVAGMGLVSVLASPPILGAEPSLAAVIFLAVVLIGTTVIAIGRGWRWLPAISFALSAPQLASYVVGPVDPVAGVVVTFGYWLVYAVASGGDAWRIRGRELGTTSASLLLGSAAFTIWAGFQVLDGPFAAWRGAFLIALALGHVVLAALFISRDGDRQPFGLLAAGTGIASLSMAVPIQFGGPPVPIAWAAEAVALAWLADRRRHEYSALVAAVLGMLAIAHVAVFEYPFGSELAAGATPFAGPAGITLAFVLGCLAAAAVVSRPIGVKVVLAAIGALLVIHAAPIELSDAALAIAWSAVFVVAALGDRLVSRLPRADREPASSPSNSRVQAWWAERPAWVEAGALAALRLPTVVAVALATGHLVAIEYALGGGASAAVAATLGPRTAALLAFLAALLIVGRAWESQTIRAILLALAAGVLLVVMPHELSGVTVIAAWLLVGLAANAAAALVLRLASSFGPGTSRDAWLQRLPSAAAVTALALAAEHAFVFELPSTEFIRGLGREGLPSHVPLTDPATVAVILFVGFLGALWLVRRRVARLPIFVAAAGALVAYLAPFELPGWLAVDAWAGLALAGVALVTIRSPWREIVGGSAVSLGALALIALVAAIAPPDRLFVSAGSLIDHPLLVSGATGASLGIVAALIAGARLQPREALAKAAWLVAGAVTVYALSVGLVDEFSSRIGGPVSVAELQKQASVGLTVLWALCGVVAFGLGVVRRGLLARYAGLALLALATAKAFLIDLAGLDVTYRVLSFIGLGIVLLVSAYVAQRWRGRISATAQPVEPRPQEPPA